MTTPARILVVGDRMSVLAALRPALRSDLAVDSATSPNTGLARVRDAGPYAVVLADFHLPSMNGIQFLDATRRLSPDTSCVLLAGPEDLGEAASAVNSGGILRVVLKPTNRAQLTGALDAGVEHYRLVTAERDLVENTLRGTVRTLIEVLALTNPTTFARATRLRDLTIAVIRASGAEVRWHDEVAAMLAQVGAIAVPADVLHDAERGDDLEAAEHALVATLPAVTDRMLAGIPRIDQVRGAILSQDARYDGQNPADPRIGAAIPFGGRALRVARDFDALTSAGAEPHTALWTMRTRHGSYDPKLIDALAAVVADRAKRRVQEVLVTELQVGMVLADEVTTAAGVTLVGSGHELTVGTLERIRGFARIPPGVSEPVRVYRVPYPRSVEAG